MTTLFNPYEVNPNPNFNYTNQYQQGALKPSGKLFEVPGLSFKQPAPAPDAAGAPAGGNIGGIATAATSAVNLFGQWKGMGDEANNINTKAPQQSFDAFGAPDYNLGQFAKSVNAIKPQGAQAGEVIGSVAQGAAAGASFGPIGALVGGAVGAIGSLIGGRRRRRKMEEKKRKANKALRVAQTNYNEAAQTSTEQRQAMTQYADQNNTSARMYNLFNIEPRLV